MKKIVFFYYFSKADLIVICTDSLIKTCSTIESEWKGEVGLKFKAHLKCLFVFDN